MKKNIVIADCDSNEIMSFIDGLKEITNETFQIDIIHECITDNLERKGVKTELHRYFIYFSKSIRYILNRRKYSTIIGWQQFFPLIICFYSNLFHLKKRNLIIACNYTYKEKKHFKRLYHWFMKKCMSGDYLDYIHVPSENYALQISKEFDFKIDKIIVAPFGIVDEYEKASRLDNSTQPQEPYFLAIGRSNRDFDFLVKTWEQEKIYSQLVIISDTYKGTTSSKKVIIKRDVGADKQYPWIAGCIGVIIPIDDGRICSGDTVLLTAMSFKKIVVVTKPSTLSEMYIKDKVNGLIVDKESYKLKKIIEDILNGKYQGLGEKARQCFLEKYSRKTLGVNIGKYVS